MSTIAGELQGARPFPGAPSLLGIACIMCVPPGAEQITCKKFLFPEGPYSGWVSRVQERRIISIAISLIGQDDARRPLGRRCESFKSHTVVDEPKGVRCHFPQSADRQDNAEELWTCVRDLLSPSLDLASRGKILNASLVF